MQLNNKVYDVLKWVAQLLLPALATFYFAIATIWGLPYVEQVIGTITAIGTLLGIMLGISTANYKGDGTMTIDLNTMDATVDTNLADMTDKKTVTLTIATIPETSTTDNINNE